MTPPENKMTAHESASLLVEEVKNSRRDYPLHVQDMLRWRCLMAYTLTSGGARGPAEVAGGGEDEQQKLCFELLHDAG